MSVLVSVLEILTDIHCSDISFQMKPCVITLKINKEHKLSLRFCTTPAFQPIRTSGRVYLPVNHFYFYYLNLPLTIFVEPYVNLAKKHYLYRMVILASYNTIKCDISQPFRLGLDLYLYN